MHGLPLCLWVVLENSSLIAGTVITLSNSSVARGGGGSYSLPHWHVDQSAEWEKHYVFSTFETVLCIGVDYIVI